MFIPPTTRRLIDRYKGSAALLDGEPAKIVCAPVGPLDRQPFAMVASMVSAARAEFAWETVARIMDNGGSFSAGYEPPAALKRANFPLREVWPGDAA